MKRNKILATVLSIALLAALTVVAVAEGSFGAAAVTSGQTYTLEQMLTYAMQDEYMAQAEYTAIQNTFGATAPFANIAKAEETHIALLKPLFETYGVVLPENTAETKVSVPETIADAYNAGIAAENANIAMYAAFLSQTDLPQDVRNVFNTLQNASQNHLTAFTRNAQNGGWGMRYGRGMGNMRGNNQACFGLVNDGTVQNGSLNCPMYGDTATACPGCGVNNGGATTRNGCGRMGGGWNRAN